MNIILLVIVCIAMFLFSYFLVTLVAWLACDDDDPALRLQAPQFSLSCISCDAGGDLVSIETAERFGWRDIHQDSQGRSTHFLGVCPQCQTVWMVIRPKEAKDAG